MEVIFFSGFSIFFSGEEGKQEYAGCLCSSFPSIVTNLPYHSLLEREIYSMFSISLNESF